MLLKAINEEKEDMEHGKATERHGWLTANGTKHIISKTNRKMPMEQNKREQFIIRRIGGTTYKVRVVFNENGGETMEDKILRIVRNDMVTNDGTYGIMEAPQMSRQSERSAS